MDSYWADRVSVLESCCRDPPCTYAHMYSYQRTFILVCQRGKQDEAAIYIHVRVECAFLCWSVWLVMYVCVDVGSVCMPTGLGGPGDVPGAALSFFGCQIQQLPKSFFFFSPIIF